MSNNHTSSANATTLAPGWVAAPNGRGTIDVVWSSLLTVFLCTWTAVCLNLPHPNDGNLQILRRRFKWMIWAIVGPELVLSVAIGQYASARRSVARFRKLIGKGEKWTLRHGFFADMGGMLLQPRDSTPFLVNSRQLAYLVEKKYLECPSITGDEIWDESKADTLARILTLVQTVWFMIQLLGRAILRLPTSTLELSAGSIVLCTLGTFICWLHKPSDVRTGIVLTTSATTAQILCEAGDAASSPYIHTPLDFVAKQSFTFGYDVAHHFGRRFDHPERPLRRFPNDRFPDISPLEKFALFCMTSAFAAFHLIGWDFTFPSRIELILWRVSSSIITVAIVLYWVLETIAARQRFGRWDKYLIWLRLKKKKPATDAEVTVVCRRQDTVDRLDAFEREQREAKPILPWEIGLIFPIILLYAAARAYMLVEMFASLRALPFGVYQTFDLADIFPHG